MGIDPKIENATRKMLDHVLKDDLEQIPRVVQDIGDDRFRECVGLCVRISGYIAVDVLGPDWPTDAGLRRMAEHAADSALRVELRESEIYDYLRTVAIGFQRIDAAFATREDILSLPIAITAALILTFCPRGKKIWAYLDDLEAALELAEAAQPAVLPAMILRAHRIEAEKAK